MSTRSTTWLVQGNGAFAPIEGQPLEDYDVEARLYRHSDGYPEGHGADLRRFFAAVESQTSDRRYGDASYLAAKLLVHLARAYASTFAFEGTDYVETSHADTRPLDFLGVGIVSQDPGDIDYVYVIDCASADADGRPLVHCFAVRTGPLGGARDTYLGAEQTLPTMDEALAEVLS